MEQIQGQKVTENIYYCPDGKYRWVYELNMLTNPIILLTIWKIFGILILIQIVFSFLIDAFQGNLKGWFTDYLFTPGFLIVPGILFGISLIAYVIVACIYGWKYMVLFEMDHKGIDHIQMPKQFKKAEGLAWLTAMAGLVTGNFTRIVIYHRSLRIVLNQFGESDTKEYSTGIVYNGDKAIGSVSMSRP